MKVNFFHKILNICGNLKPLGECCICRKLVARAHLPTGFLYPTLIGLYYSKAPNSRHRNSGNIPILIIISVLIFVNDRTFYCRSC